MKLNVEQFLNKDYLMKYSNGETRLEMSTGDIDNILDMINIVFRKEKKRLPFNYEYIRVEGYFE